MEDSTNMNVQICFGGPTFNYFGCRLRNQIPSSHDNSIFSVLRNCSSVLHGGISTTSPFAFLPTAQEGLNFPTPLPTPVVVVIIWFQCLFIFRERERERERESVSGGGTVREGDRESQAQSMPTVQSPTRGSIPRTVRS